MKYRNKKGRFAQDPNNRKPFGQFMLGVTIISFGILLWQGIVGSGTVLSVENADAEVEFHMPTMKEEVLYMIKEAGLDVELAEKIVQHESWWQEDNTHINKDGSRDRGLWMISEVWHPEVTDSCAYDYYCSTLQAIRIWKERGPQEWVAYWYVR